MLDLGVVQAHHRRQHSTDGAVRLVMRPMVR
jgi:hypothetical protein